MTILVFSPDSFTLETIQKKGLIPGKLVTELSGGGGDMFLGVKNFNS
jgi:hypothetical protein